MYDEDITQEDIYNETAASIIDSVLEGYNGTIFAYGQTGAGKTHTMAGPQNPTAETKGLLPRAFEHIFSSIHMADPNITEY